MREEVWEDEEELEREKFKWGGGGGDREEIGEMGITRDTERPIKQRGGKNVQFAFS